MSMALTDQRFDGIESYVMALLLISLLPLLALPAFASEDPTSFEQLVSDLDHPDSERCWNAIDTLGAHGDRRAVQPLMAALRKDMKQRRGFAMAIIPALGRLGDARAVPLLIKALNKRDDGWLGRTAAAQALGDIGSSKAVPTLIRAAWLADTRDAAIVALAAIGDSRAIDVLLSTFDESEDQEVLEAALVGLVRIGRAAIPALTDKLGARNKEYPANRERALTAHVLGKIGDQRAVVPLTAALDDPSAKVRKSARAALELLAR